MQCEMLKMGCGYVGKFSNERNGLWLRVCGRLLIIVIMLLVKKRERGFFTFAAAWKCICGETQKSAYTLKST